MVMAPLKLLLTGYALSGAAALMIAATGGGALTSLLAFWLGGPVAVFALATLPGVRRGFRDETRNAVADSAGDSAGDAAGALASMERDRIADRPEREARATG